MHWEQGNLNFDNHYCLFVCKLIWHLSKNRWLAYADKKLISWNRSTGGYEGENGHSYTATVLHAAKSLSQSLRDLSGTVANSISGVHNSNSSYNITVPSDSNQMNPGVITIIDIKVSSNFVLLIFNFYKFSS